MEKAKKYWWAIAIGILLIILIIYFILKNKKSCPPESTGTYPNCRPKSIPICPQGTTGIYPNCTHINTPVCPAGTTGTYPNCVGNCPPSVYTNLDDLWKQSVACAIKQIPTAQWPDAVKAKAISYLSDPGYANSTSKRDAVSANAISDNITLQQEIVNDAYANAK